jgi:glucose-1-phosphate cytidylyltransferase
MKVIILAGGLGTRLSEYTNTIPKPMIKIGRYPILIHIINHYLKYGFNDFILATGYKNQVFKKYYYS